MTSLRPSRRVAALAIALLAVAGLSSASASQLAVDGGTLQSGVGLLVDCQPAGTPIGVSFTSAFSSGAYRTTAITFDSVDPSCNGLAYRVQLIDTNGSILDTHTSASATDAAGTVSLVSGAFSVTVPSTATASIGKVALVLTD